MSSLEAVERRFLERGPQSLDDPELLALVLRRGRRGRPILDMARGLIDQSGSLGTLLGADPQRLSGLQLPRRGRVVVLAVAELCRRCSRERIVQNPLARPAAVVDYLAHRYPGEDQEIFGALFLDSRHRLIAERELFRGGLGSATVEPRQVLREALYHRAAGLLVFHNHPSGDPTPSDQDWVFTRRLFDAAELLGVRLVDHLVIGDRRRWISMGRLWPW